MNDDTTTPLTYFAAASTSATDTAQGGYRHRQPGYWAPEPRNFSGKTDEDMDAWLKQFDRQCHAFEALKTRRILPKLGRLDNVSTVASMNVATCEDIPFLVRQVVREELVRLQAGDVHHQSSFAACHEPPPYWMRERHVENRPRTETQILPRGFRFPRRVAATIGCHHLDVPLRTSDRRQPGLYQKITMRHHKTFLRSTTHLRVLLPPLLLLIRPAAPPRFSTYLARMYETPVPPRFSTHPPRMHETWTFHPAYHHPRKQWPNEFRSESPVSERSLTPPPTRSRRSPSPRRQSPSPHQLGN
ncbi:hypothetical protein HPB51_007447 [Rhipicephalus microplus]|uniref:Uncharacterized protein n=1 Tax=Rhipicephalus microplus TaxID=6941 RepID=A0A9J6EZ02_RHIMP|nr:hypothetical protein HPB51_007447 [Rhipicephalus microplus]